MRPFDDDIQDDQEIADADWELLNAWHDGELPPDQATAFKQRLSAEPHLAAAARELHAASGALAGLRPALPGLVGETPVSQTERRPRHRSVVAWSTAAAASVLLVVGIYLAGIWSPATLADVHADFLAQDFAASDIGAVRAVANVEAGGMPDLRAANLTLVAAAETEALRVAHYAGRNGCRLTFAAGVPPIDMGASPGAQTVSWTVDDHAFALMATGMDHGKFQAITAYLQQVTIMQARPDTVLAVREATENAVPCA